MIAPNAPLRDHRRARESTHPGGCMSFRSMLFVLVAVLVLAACSKFSGGGAAWQGDPQKAHEVAAGMTQDAVKAILGEPSTTQVMKLGDQSLTAWYYVGDKGAVNVVFDTAGSVMTVGLDGKVLVAPPQ
jgi:outer membrane protein assembly factor BamE (lipoprotein component of BamABCDE complex)